MALTETDLVIVAPTSPPPLELTVLWARHLHEQVGNTSLLLEGQDAVRAGLVSACGTSARALAFFGHGREDRLEGHSAGGASAVALLQDSENEFRFTWVYALACLSARELGPALQGRCCQVFVGFDQELAFPNHEPRALDAFKDLAIAAPRALHAGQHQESTLRQTVRAAAAEAQRAAGGMERLGFIALHFWGQLQEFVFLA